ncbi:hypothetical protein FRC17_009083 [Serendipita sp. 399]|nr:hypothetical protein FRC17_009083 [Serendipita sp. 399]
METTEYKLTVAVFGEDRLYMLGSIKPDTTIQEIAQLILVVLKEGSTNTTSVNSADLVLKQADIRAKDWYSPEKADDLERKVERKPQLNVLTRVKRIWPNYQDNEDEETFPLHILVSIPPISPDAPTSTPVLLPVELVLTNRREFDNLTQQTLTNNHISLILQEDDSINGYRSRLKQKRTYSEAIGNKVKIKQPQSQK